MDEPFMVSAIQVLHLYLSHSHQDCYSPYKYGALHILLLDPNWQITIVSTGCLKEAAASPFGSYESHLLFISISYTTTSTTTTMIIIIIINITDIIIIIIIIAIDIRTSILKLSSRFDTTERTRWTKHWVYVESIKKRKSAQLV